MSMEFDPRVTWANFLRLSFCFFTQDYAVFKLRFIKEDTIKHFDEKFERVTWANFTR